MIKGQWTFNLVLEAAPYILAASLAPILLREGSHGLIALVWLCFVVWGTDVGAYFAGRAIGGAKLMPTVSPNKTWSGAIGGAILGAGLGVYIPYLFGVKITVMLFVVAFITSIISQIGDLYESHFKRRMSVKDSSQLIPGHGGVMDRLDGFITAGVIAVIIGILHNKADIAKGLLVW
jgi:phosphatidate cytidylyltransferase